MKNLSSILLSLTVLVIINSACSCKGGDNVITPTTYTVSYNANGGTGTTASSSPVTAGTSITLAANGFTYTGFTFTGWNTSANGSGTAYAAGASYTVNSNVTLYAQWQANAPVYTAVFTATDLSSTEALKALPGTSANRGLKVVVTTPGTANLASIGSLTNSNIAIAYYWIVNKDSVGHTSTLNPTVAKTAMLASQTINLSAGTYIICFKTAPFLGAIANGTKIGISLTGANSNTVSNANYTADASYNATNVVKFNLKFTNGASANPGQNTGSSWVTMQITPYNDEAGTVYDGTLYPSISSVSFDTKVTTWFTGTFTNYSNLDFTNASGASGRNIAMSQTDGTGALSPVFTNSDATFASGILQFSKSSSVKLIKANLGNFAYSSISATVYNSGSTFGPANVCWWLKGITFIGNPEVWIYDPNGNRIY